MPLVIRPFRSLLHMETEDEKLARARARRRPLLEPDGRLVFDVFSPSREDIEETDGRWLEREPGIFERADWDEGSRTLLAAPCAPRRRRDDRTSHWLSAPEWLRLLDEAGLDVEARLRLVRPAAVRRTRGHDLSVAAGRPRCLAVESVARDVGAIVLVVVVVLLAVCLVVLYNRLVQRATASTTRGRRSTCSSSGAAT